MIAQDPYQTIINDLPGYLKQNSTLVQAIKHKRLHGHFVDWLEALNQSLDYVTAFNCLESLKILLNQNSVEVSATDPVDSTLIHHTLTTLRPWRKGPFKVFDVILESEWRCNLKYDRLLQHAPSVNGLRILDIGAGNGYFGFRMLGAGARQVLNIDPSQLYWCQFQAIKMWQPNLPIAQIPLTAEALLDIQIGTFDQVYSMGVLYHRKSPIDHLYLLKHFIKPGGKLILETLYVDGPNGYSLIPERTYAKMPNVWFIPSLATVETWLNRVGFREVRCVNTSVTQFEEQARTQWMQNESLANFLDPDNPNLTLEGYPRPARAIFIACS